MIITLKDKNSERYARTKFKLHPDTEVDENLEDPESSIRKALADALPENDSFIGTSNEDTGTLNDDTKIKHALTSIVVDEKTKNVNLGIYNEYKVEEESSIYNQIFKARGESRDITTGKDRFPAPAENNPGDYAGGNEYGIPSNGTISDMGIFLESLQQRIFDRQYAITKYSHRFYDDNYCKSYTINFIPENSKVTDKTYTEITQGSFLIPTAVIQVANPPSDLECRLYIRDIPILYRKTITSNNWVLFTFPEYLFDYYENFEAIQKMEFSTNQSTDGAIFYFVTINDVTISKRFRARNLSFLNFSQANSNIITYHKRNLDDSPDYNDKVGALSTQTPSVETPVVTATSKRGRKKKSTSSENTSSS